MKSAGPVIAAILVVAATLMLLYVVSVGPAIWLHQHGMLSERTAEAVYAPLAWAANSTQIVEVPLSLYASLWWRQERAPPSPPPPATLVALAPSPATPPPSAGS